MHGHTLPCSYNLSSYPGWIAISSAIMLLLFASGCVFDLHPILTFISQTANGAEQFFHGSRHHLYIFCKLHSQNAFLYLNWNVWCHAL